MVDTSELLDLAVSIAERAGRLLLDRCDDRLEISTKTSLNDFVTQIDTEAEALIVGELRSARPHDAFLGEEGSTADGSSGVRWLIDPIDGTTNFVYGHPGFAVSLAAEVDGVTEVGVVVDPMHGETFSARRGAGARRNGDLIRTTAATDLAPSIIATGFNYDPVIRQRQAAAFSHLILHVGNIRRMGAAATDLCWVACGRVDGFFEEGLQVWDYSAGALIAAEAGARTGSIRGGPPSVESVVACAPGIYDSLVDELLAAAEFSPDGTPSVVR